MKIDITEGEMIVLREAVRKLPANTEFSALYGDEIASSDRKLTAALAICFDSHNGLTTTSRCACGYCNGVKHD
jgi:hypothetical protein